MPFNIQPDEIGNWKLAGSAEMGHPVDAWMAVFPTKYNRRLKHIGRIGSAMRMGPPVKLVGDAPAQPGGVRS